jgi:hypothetical protein
MNHQENNIHNWAESLAFDQLSNSQQLEVLQEMSSDEYSELFESNKAFTLLFQEEKELLEPKDSSLELLKLAALEKNKKPVVLRLWTRSIPLYAATAACLFILAFSYALFHKKIDKAIPVVEEQYLTRVVRDTVYLEKEIVEQVVHTVYVPVKKQKSTRAITTQYVPDESILVKEISPLPNAAGITKSYGNSSVDLASLEQFKVQM